jgi:hypothetical protein
MHHHRQSHVLACRVLSRTLGKSRSLYFVKIDLAGYHCDPLAGGNLMLWRDWLVVPTGLLAMTLGVLPDTDHYVAGVFARRLFNRPAGNSEIGPLLLAALLWPQDVGSGNVARWKVCVLSCFTWNIPGQEACLALHCIERPPGNTRISHRPAAGRT